MAFVLVVGPSGAGKDTLIRRARSDLAGDPRFAFPRRLVTRPPSADEDNVPLTAEAFSAMAAEGRFALSWQAHGLGYALPEEAGRLARDGCGVVCNVSRRVVEEARVRFPGTVVVEITAPPDVLARRLAARGRPEDGNLAARLARTGPVVPDLTIDNSGPPEEGARLLIQFLRDLQGGK
ncbi:phosphonate metabolism protein/1,5-bisphosphokinase (PRPP-forming) PhnN [Methylobacterium persicinum]|uniref:Ribose 1,5-bisphosphate phosphokinase PhnN n=1 Tax=Methylobacterium persicinum TaxID=374426 RepID=A0ABU0HEX8_9HYPH|nr:phosphonate metabolism protein/1,5-bisphosphokinase (PRPP-forming) PhnN [Methylobacterium persicinum]MDQ0440850.1 ribose 1,5-bisphosphokinase [Methylobacterium persicinum]GJE39683.1 Ribose 1,5-bisphosphate phosphokinase PhnN [Methylobacterium persicinum]